MRRKRQKKRAFFTDFCQFLAVHFVPFLAIFGKKPLFCRFCLVRKAFLSKKIVFVTY